MASGFKADPQGFLIGEVLENGRDLMRLQGQSYAVLKDIRTDVRAIGRAVGAQVASTIRTSRPGVAPRAPASAAMRTAGGNYTGGRRAAVATPAARGAPAQRGVTSARANVAVTQPRSANGRFMAGNQRPGGGGAAGGGERGGNSVMSRLSDSVGKLANSLSAVDNVDPTLNAAKEIRDVVAPLGRGLSFMFGRTAERKTDTWRRRILKLLTPGGTKGQPASGGVYGAGGGGIAGSIGGGLIGRLAGGALGGLLGVGKGLLKGGAGLLRRVPLLGALLAGGSALFSAFGGDDDPNASPAQNRARRYHNTGQAVGMGVGAIAGGALGSLLGPLGTVGGAWLGSLIGEKVGGAVGDWTKALIDANVPGKVVEAWKVTTAAIGAAWESLSADAKSAWTDITTKASEWLDAAKSGIETVGKTLSDAGNSINSWIEAKTGFNAKGAVSSAAGAVGDAASSAWDATKKAANAGWSAAKGYGSDALDAAGRGAAALVPDTARRAYKAGATAAASVADWSLGKTSKHYESGNGGAGTISSGKGDHGGVSYGSYQLSSKAGTLTKFLKQSPYGAQFDGLTPGSPEFNAKWKEVAKNDPNFGSAQHEFVKSTHYDPMAAGLKKDGIDVEGRGAAVKDAVWSTAVQFGGDSKLIQRALKGKDASKMTDAEMISAIQDYKATNNESLFSKSSAAVRASTLARAANEKTSLLKLDAGVAAPNIPQIRSAAVPSSVPITLPQAPKIDDLTSPLNSLGSGAGREPVQVNISEPIGQNVTDRNIAHVISGGLGMG